MHLPSLWVSSLFLQGSLGFALILGLLTLESVNGLDSIDALWVDSLLFLLYEWSHFIIVMTTKGIPCSEGSPKQWGRDGGQSQIIVQDQEGCES